MADELKWMSEEEFQRMAAIDLKNLSATVRVNPGKMPFEQMTDPTYLQPAIELELEFKVYSFQFDMDCNALSVGHNTRIQSSVQDILNDGWQIDDKIICPPFVMLVLSRKKGKQ